MALKILKSMKKDVSVKHMIHKAVAGYEEPRGLKHIHASEVTRTDLEFCPRFWAYVDAGVVALKPEFISTVLRMTFDHGRDVESRLQNDWLREFAVGHWRCKGCNHLHDVFSKAPKINCPKCGMGHLWEYEEVRFMDPVSGTSGGVDLFLDVGEKKLRLVEIKTMDKDMHKGLKAPLAEHKQRTSLYLTLVEKSGTDEAKRINTKEATIIYVAKAYGFKDTSMKEAGIVDAPFSAIKEFTIKANPKDHVNYLNRAETLTHWRELIATDEGHHGMPCGICPNGLTKRAQKCPAVGPCFSGNYPSTITWRENGKPVHEGKPIVVGE